MPQPSLDDLAELVQPEDAPGANQDDLRQVAAGHDNGDRDDADEDEAEQDVRKALFD